MYVHVQFHNLCILRQIDAAVKDEGCVLPCEEAPGHRLIYAPIGAVDLDYDDVRKIREAAKRGIKR